MRHNSLNERHRKRYYRYRRNLIISCILLCILIVAFAETFEIKTTLTYALGFAMMVIFQLSLTVVLGFMMSVTETKKIGLNQMHEFDEKQITVLDTSGDMNIENTFEWGNIVHIERVPFGSIIDYLLGKQVYGVLIIADKKRFYKAINRKEKSINKQDKRQLKLSGGFFIQSDDEEIATIESYWGKEIKEYI